MEVKNVKVYDMEESLVASGYPMNLKVGDMRPENEKDWSRALKLVKACGADNMAHGQFLTGIRVAFDLTCTNKMWVEAERYRFLEFVSSQSTMHKIAQLDIRECCNEYVDEKVINTCIELQNKYYRTRNPEDYLKLLYNLPSGFELTARMTTNYRCLMNIYWQRRNHRLPEWRQFCEWIETLPGMRDLLQAYYEGKEDKEA